MGKNLKNEPVGYTCRDIDSVQSDLKNIIVSLEGLRDSNDALRSWGQDLLAALEEAEERVYELEQELEELRSSLEKSE